LAREGGLTDAADFSDGLHVALRQCSGRVGKERFVDLVEILFAADKMLHRVIAETMQVVVLFGSLVRTEFADGVEQAVPIGFRGGGERQTQILVVGKRRGGCYVPRALHEEGNNCLCAVGFVAGPLRLLPARGQDGEDDPTVLASDFDFFVPVAAGTESDFVEPNVETGRDEAFADGFGVREVRGRVAQETIVGHTS